MSKLYFLLVLFCSSQISFAQCPIINGALVNSCAPNGPTEGANEFAIFTTGASATVDAYLLNYGSNNPPSESSTGILAGINATTKTGIGNITVQGGCSMIEVTSPSTVIPANSRVVFIPSVFDVPYDLTALCTNGTLYVVYIDRTALPSKWGLNGTFANSPSGFRFIQLEFNGDPCTSNIRAYNNLWPTNLDGNSVSWDANDVIYFQNDGCSVVTIPVKLISLSAVQKDNDVNVAWQTTNEINVKSFEVQRSVDGVHFTTVGIVSAKGNSASVNDYSFVDHNINSGTNFYRIQTIDTDGSSSYSYIVKILNVQKGQLTKVYPDISSGKLHVEINAATSGPATAVLFDYAGRVLSKNIVRVNQGYNHLQLDIGKLPAGGYVLKLSDNKGTTVARFSKP